MQQKKILYWLKELLFWNHSDIMKKRILKDIEKQRGNKHQEFGWFIALLDENDFSNGLIEKLKYFYSKNYNNRLIFIVNTNKKELTIKNLHPRNQFGSNVTITLPLHSGVYLPEIPVPDTEYEKYKEMQQNLQQAIEIETGLKFDTQQFLLQYKEKLGI